MSSSILEFPTTRTDTRTALEIVRDYHQDADAVHKAWHRDTTTTACMRAYMAGKVDAAMELQEALEQAQEDRT